MLQECVKSIRKKYPDLKLIVADDSKKPTPIDDIEYITLPFDSGLGAGRNALIDQVKTKYTLHLDDDWVFFQNTDIKLMLQILKKSKLDLLSGMVINTSNGSKNAFYGNFSEEDGRLVYARAARNKKVVDGHEVFIHDFVCNFYMAKTEALKSLRWDAKFKTGGLHSDFFYRAHKKIKIGHCNDIEIHHADSSKYHKYKKYRCRAMNYYNLFLKKHKFTEAVMFGKIIQQS